MKKLSPSIVHGFSSIATETAPQISPAAADAKRRTVMFTARRLSASCFLILCLLTMVVAQTQQQSIVEPTASQTSTTVTASATADRVRFTAPSNVVRMQLQVISESGQILFEVSSKGNVLDWSLQDSSGQRLQGPYLLVATVKSLSGRLSERIGSVLVQEQQVELKPVEATGLSPAQQQAVGPIEESATLIMLRADERQPVTVVANDGKDGQIVRERGALSFRLGDFFSGNDTEQMRLTEEGNLGIGTAKPKARLDVAGMISAREGFMFSDGSTLKVNEKGVLTRTNADGTGPNAVTSTQNRIAKFTDNAGTLGDSLVQEGANGTALQLTAPVSASVDTNILYLDSTSKTTGVIGGSQPSFQASSGPYFAMRGNTYTAIGGGSQRGLFAISAGDIPGATGRQGSILFNTGPDQMRVTGKPPGGMGVGTATTAARLDVVGNVKVSGNGNGFFFADGTTMTTAGITQPQGDARYARLLAANAFNGNQSVTGNVSATGAVSGASASFTGDVNTTTQYNIGGNRVFSVAGNQ